MTTIRLSSATRCDAVDTVFHVLSQRYPNSELNTFSSSKGAHHVTVPTTRSMKMMKMMTHYDISMKMDQVVCVWVGV